MRKRVKGRFVKEAEAPPERIKPTKRVDGKQGGAGDLAGAPRPKNCRVYTRARFAEALPEVTKTLLREAKKGSVAHLKLLVQISGLDKGDVAPGRAKRRDKSLEEILTEEWKKEQENRPAEESNAGSAARLDPDYNLD